MEITYLLKIGLLFSIGTIILSIRFIAAARKHDRPAVLTYVRYWLIIATVSAICIWFDNAFRSMPDVSEPISASMLRSVQTVMIVVAILAELWSVCTTILNYRKKTNSFYRNLYSLAITTVILLIVLLPY